LTALSKYNSVIDRVQIFKNVLITTHINPNIMSYKTEVLIKGNQQQIFEAIAKQINPKVVGQYRPTCFVGRGRVYDQL
jgi:hypothetical protein